MGGFMDFSELPKDFIYVKDPTGKLNISGSR